MFEDPGHKDRVIREGPWSFDKYLVLLKQFADEIQVSKIIITEATFCIRLYDLPLHAMTERVASLIG